jgi:glycosyltransferase involved in cell wall biosynthesis
MVVGSGTRFLSGISVYTVRLANALADAGARVSMMTMRQLLPTRLYPGRARVGKDLTDLGQRSSIPVFDGIDWHWLPSLVLAARFMRRQRPDVLILEWWSGSVLHSYFGLCLLARALGTRVIIEFHEVLDTGEARIPLVSQYARIAGGLVLHMAAGFAVHSDFDRELLSRHWPLGDKPVVVLPHGPHDHYQAGETTRLPLREAPQGVCNLLFFGIIRPYKGLEDLVEAFDRLTDEEVGGFWLTVVGETWEGYTLPAERIAASRHQERITYVDGYVHDADLDAYLRGADAVVLPYRRSSLSGPLHVAMSYGLPIVMTDVGGNAEAAAGYGGIELVPGDDPMALLDRIRQLRRHGSRRYQHPHAWSATAEVLGRLLDDLDPERAASAETAAAETGRAASYAVASREVARVDRAGGGGTAADEAA